MKILLIWLICILGIICPPLGVFFIFLAFIRYVVCSTSKENEDMEDYYRRRNWYFRNYYGV